MEPRTVTPGYRTQSRDTDEWADRLQFEHWSRLEPWEKAALVSDLCESAHRLHILGMRQRFSAASDEELELRSACARLGQDLVEAVLGRPVSFREEDRTLPRASIRSPWLSMSRRCSSV